MPSALIILSNLSVATDGVTVTGTISGGNGTYLPASNVTGLTPKINGAATGYGSSSISATTLTLVLASPVLTDGTLTIDVATSPTSNLTDSVGDTPAGQLATPVANQSLIGRYTNITALQNRFGSYNILVYSDTNATNALNIPAVQDDMNEAMDFIDSQLGNLYVTPLVFSNGKVPSMVAGWAKVLACEILFTSRGFSEGEKGNVFTPLADTVRATLIAYRCGELSTLPTAQRLVTEASGPEATIVDTPYSEYPSAPSNCGPGIPNTVPLRWNGYGWS